MLTQNEARALANLLHKLRPNWTPDQVLRYCEEHHQDITLDELVLPAVLAALNPVIRSPKLIFEQGAHWDTAKTIRPARYEPERPAMCEDHPTYQARNCHCCWADVKAGQRDRDHIGRHQPPTQPPATATAPRKPKPGNLDPETIQHLAALIGLPKTGNTETAPNPEQNNTQDAA